MPFLSNLKIITKILIVIGFLGSIAGGLSYIAITGMDEMNASSERMDQAATNARLVASLGANVLAIGRAEAQLGTDPRPEAVEHIRGLIDTERTRFADRLARVREAATGEIAASAEQVASEWDAFLVSVDKTVAAAEGVKGFEMTGATADLREQLELSNQKANALRQTLIDVSKDLENRVGDLKNEATAQYEASSRLLLIVTFAGILLGIGVGFAIAKFGIADPLRRLVAMVQRLAGGEFDIEIDGRERKDEVGEIAQAVEAFKVKLADEARQEAEEKIVADRELAEKRRTEMNRMADDFENAVGEIVNIVSSAATELQAAASTLTASAEETSSQSASVAAAAEQAAMNVQTVASAVEELASSAGEIGRQAEQSREVAGRAVSEATRTTDRMGELRSNADQIGAIISLIDEIAEKTNLLALNATIEAARAGDAGRGFAVVAQEVKGLAEQTAKATAEISTQIKSMQSSTLEASEAISGIGRTIDDMSNISAAIFSAVGEQGNTTTEVARNVQQASQGAEEVTSNIVGVTQAAQEASSASAQVLASASELAQQSEVLRSRMAEFLRTVRAA
ncbi:methyl-accepting chemotaxis protein [Stappia sp. 28M-7]|uniref:methyl-accepting chemotaxis protein n=1 Tax=Stappia sp. 28M-7 TaxID=2762596 RepID=UPI00163C68C7|nr:methyl-accepting chemotaxis protein [Stappia sp. 28M-7]MBC2858383.1 HAMP domain-containing protein [Stappia sp. 28M-7]